jgi:hypothetical protein
MKLERKREMEQLKNREEGLTSTGCCSVKCSCHFHNWVFKHVQVQAYHKGFLLQLIFQSFLIMMCDGDDDDSEFVEVDPTGCYGWVSVGMTFLSSSCCYFLLLSFLIFFVFP